MNCNSDTDWQIIIFHLPIQRSIRSGYAENGFLKSGGSLPKDFVFNELGVEQWIAVEKID